MSRQLDVSSTVGLAELDTITLLSFQLLNFEERQPYSGSGKLATPRLVELTALPLQVRGSFKLPVLFGSVRSVLPWQSIARERV